ncbi:hypothetical protein [Pseudomonas sp. ML96]|uniref:hypothetical protein n=1 Tax=Pseudomonas sp. ML96 TaxID=1523503 RepID=UPI00068B1E1B|nr:hypothetical protein [Pseudomonas sp. ML96]
MKHFVDAVGMYLGGWDEGSLSGELAPPSDATEVPDAPSDVRQRWQFPGWPGTSPGEALDKLRDECDRRLAALKRDYPDSEVLSWDKQEAEARAGGGPLVAALAVARGIDEAELIRRILQKAEAFAVLSGTIIGQRQALEDRVRAGEVEVAWPTE